MNDADVIVVGAGLTGLRAAYEISRTGASVLVVEQGTNIGGRLQSTVQDGFILDHGFQVIPSAYPELELIRGFDSLGLQPFTPGVRVFSEGKFFDLLDYRAGVPGMLSLMRAPFLSYADLAALGRFALLGPRDAPKATGLSTLETLRRCGFSQRCIDTLLAPFLSGVLLDASLSLDGGLARFYMGAFARGRALLPAGGIQALPDLLAAQVGRSHIILAAEVVQLSAREVVLASGETLRAKRVICAVDALRAAELGSATQTMPFGGCATVYFSTKSPPYAEPLLCINAEPGRLVNHLAVLSTVQPSYAPPGRHLVSATVVISPESERTARVDLHEAVASELATWFGDAAVKEWEHLATFRVSRAVPLRPRLSPGWSLINGIYFAGDYLSYGAQNGALAAGRTVAREVIEGLGVVLA